MKKLLLLLLVAVVLLTITLSITTQGKTCSCGNPYCTYNAVSETQARKRVNAYIKKYVRKGKYKNFKVKFISYKKLTYKKLVNRKKNKIIYVEIIDGFVINDNNYAGLTGDGYYISYEGIDDRLPKGTKIRTYCIYDPSNNYEDDIISRSDRVISIKGNSKAIRKAKKLFKKRFGSNHYKETYN